VPLPNRSWQRQAHRIHGLKRWSAKLGIKVNIEPRFFPADIDLASCMVIGAQRRGLPVADLVNAILAALWAEDANPADPQVLTALASKHGLDGTSLLAEAVTKDVREEYGKNTQRALDAGIFDLPSMSTLARYSGARTGSICWKRSSSGTALAISVAARQQVYRR
jgi:2-hydroxychromene-2-carboxylate isomerase